jgi:hypothetical protein
MIRTLVRLAFGCHHEHTFRERRWRYGLQIPHFICEDCGYAVPVIDRTPEEYRAHARSQVPLPKARKLFQPSAAERARVIEAVAPAIPFRRAK